MTATPCPERAKQSAELLRIIDKSRELDDDQAIRDWCRQFDKEARQARRHVNKCDKCKNGLSNEQT